MHEARRKKAETLRFMREEQDAFTLAAAWDSIYEFRLSISTFVSVGHWGHGADIITLCAVRILRDPCRYDLTSSVRVASPW